MKSYATLIAFGALVISTIGLVHSIQTSWVTEEIYAATQRTKLLTKINQVELIAGTIAFHLERIRSQCANTNAAIMETTGRIMDRALEREGELRRIRMAYSDYQEPIGFPVIENRLVDIEIARQNHQLLLDVVLGIDEDLCKPE